MPVDRPARHADARHHPVRRGAPQNAGERRNPETSTGHMAHVTFKQMMNEVVAFASCCECSTCVLVCPHNVIEYIDAKPKQVAKPTAAFDYCGISEGIGCDVCSGLPPPRRPRVRHARRGPPGRAGRVRGPVRPLPSGRCRALQGSRDPGAPPGRRRRDSPSLSRVARGLVDGACVSEAADESSVPLRGAKPAPSCPILPYTLRDFLRFSAGVLGFKSPLLR